MSDLFDTAKPEYEPLASRMRPRTLEEYIGQDHILGPGRLLRRAIARDQLSSLIFYGPPGTGKTTLARVIAGSTKSHFLSLNAVLAGVKDIRDNIEKASLWRKMDGKRTILFVDEVHRWNKSQQDALLPWVENGTFILIGATTENPYFEVNSALVSRSRVFQLLPLTSDDLSRIAWQALADPVRGYGRWTIGFEPGSLEHLVEVANGDARSLLNALELAVETACETWPPVSGTEISISLADAEESIQRRVVLYDKDGDYHFDTISAFIKSLRGSDPDAALYWLAKMVRAGEDPAFLFRRMLISACEDVGLADPNALVVVEACARAFERIGLPEGQYHLTQAALYLATAPKSNSALGYFDALKTVEAEKASEVPVHLKDGSRDKKAFGHGADYKYPHAYRDHWVAQDYLPAGLARTTFYTPGSLGFEGRLREDILRKKELTWAAVEETPSKDAVLTYGPEEGWRRRLEFKAGVFLEGWRQYLFDQASVVRHHRVLIPQDHKGLLLLEALRRTPEGLCASPGLSPEQKAELQGRLKAVPDLSRPLLGAEELPTGEVLWDRVLYWNPDFLPSTLSDQLASLEPSLAPGAKILALWIGPPESLLPPQAPQQALDLERQFLARGKSPLFALEKNDWIAVLPDSWSLRWEKHPGEEELELSPQSLDTWLDPHRAGGWGQALAQGLTAQDWEAVKSEVKSYWTGRVRSWKRTVVFLELHRPPEKESPREFADKKEST